MGIFDEVKKELAYNDLYKKSSMFFEDCLNALMGDPVAIYKVARTLKNFPFFIQNHVFWRKIEQFLDGVYISDDDRKKMCAKLAEDGKREENAMRLLAYIDRAETNQKIDYIINATRNFIIGNIDKAVYFRICHAVANTIDEDLKFLANNINNKKMEVNIHTNGLFISGLMYQSDIDASGCNNRYSFTELARVLDKYALSYNDVAKYPITDIYTLPSVIEQETTIQSNIDFVKTFEEASKGYS